MEFAMGGSKSKIMSKVHVVLCFFLLSILFTACGNNRKVTDYEIFDPPVGEQLISPITEQEIDIPQEILGEIVAKDEVIVWVGESILSDNIICKWIIVGSKDKTQTCAYNAFYDVDNHNWVVRASENAEYRIEKIQSGMDGHLYCFLNDIEGECHLARLHENGEYEIVQSIDKDLADKLINTDGSIFTDANGEIWRTESTGDIWEDNLISVVERYNPDGDVTEKYDIRGYILGAYRQNETINFYGWNEDEDAAIWTDQREAILDVSYLSKKEYNIIMNSQNDMFIVDRSSVRIKRDDGIDEIFKFSDNGFIIDTVLGVSISGEDKLHILVKMDGSEVLLTYDYTQENVEEPMHEITIALAMRNTAFEDLLARFKRKYPIYTFHLIYPDEKETLDDFCKRIKLEISVGKGPDIMAGDLGIDYDNLARKGYIANLERWKIDTSGCIESALRDCEYDGKLYAIPYDFNLDFVIYRKSDFKNAKTITLNQFVKTMRKSDYSYIHRGMIGSEIILLYALNDEGNDDYIDWKNGKSHLESKSFINLMEFAKEYADDSNGWGSYDQGIYYVTSYYLPGAEKGAGSLNAIVTTYLELGEEGVFLGYPTQKGNGNYLIANKLYVKEATAEKYGICSFFNYILSEEAQNYYQKYDYSKGLYASGGLYRVKAAGFSVNHNVLSESIENAKVEYGDKMGSLLENLFVDIDNAKIYHYRMAEVQKILEEELDAYFYGEATAQHVAEIIDNRVQLYLDEVTK